MKPTDRAAFTPARVVRPIPSGTYTPVPCLMGRGGYPLVLGEELLSEYFAVRLWEPDPAKRVATPPDLLVVPLRRVRNASEGTCVALYASAEDAAMARQDWFRATNAEVLCIEQPVSDVVRPYRMSAEKAVEIRRQEAEGRGEHWVYRMPHPPKSVGLPAPIDTRSPLRGYWPALVLVASLAVLWFVWHLP